MDERDKRVLSVVSASGKWVSIKSIHRKMMPKLDYHYLKRLVWKLYEENRLDMIETTSGPMFNIKK